MLRESGATMFAYVNGNMRNDAPKPNPQRLNEELTIDTVDNWKRSDCNKYEKCLDVAANANWQQFHCNACEAYDVNLIDSDEQALIKLGKLLNGNNKQ